MANDDDLLEAAISRATGLVAGEQATAAGQASDRAGRAEFIETQMDRMRQLLVQYAKRLRGLQQPLTNFHTTIVRSVKGKHQVDVNPHRLAGYLIGFHAHSSSDYARHQDFMRRMLLTADGQLWGFIGRRSTGGMFSREVITAQPTPAGNFPFYRHMEDIEGFAYLLALDHGRRTMDKRYADALFGDLPDGDIQWIWERSDQSGD